MAVVRPFRAVRPRAELAAAIAALPYDVMSSAEAKEMVEGSELSFLRIDRAEINFPEMMDPHDPRVYAKAREIFEKMLEKQHLIQDEQAYFYIYRQVMGGRVQTGLVACTAVDDCINGVIKKHELTRPDKEHDRVEHIKALQAQTGPIFQAYRDREEIRQLIDGWVKTHEPLYQFSAFGVDHLCWLVDSRETIAELEHLFSAVDCLYIADGHHRSAAAVRVGRELREQSPDPQAEFNYFLSVLFPASDLKILPYNRLVKDLAGLSSQEFFQQIEERFALEQAPASPYAPEQKGTFGMYTAGRWYKLTPHPGLVPRDDPVKSLDVSILQDHLLAPILKIQDPRRDERIDFVGGIRGLKELERRCREDRQVAFSLYPTSIEELFAVADRGQVMPPKSTWFEPKLLSGLFIHKLF